MRGSGILLHLSSLSSPYGIGTMGKEAYQFVDFLKESEQKYWQLLPISPTSYGDSPYQSFSIYAGNPYFIDFEILTNEGLLLKEEYEEIDWGKSATIVDYSKLYQNRYTVLHAAFNRFLLTDKKGFSVYKKSHSSWLSDYGLFMALKFKNDGKPWSEWEINLRNRETSVIASYKKDLFEEIEFWSFVQFKFFKQWSSLKKYANKNSIKLIGDIPIYCALDSADVWMNPSLFLLDNELNPTEVAGCPPDYFSPTGQLWGNPLYNWKLMKQDNYLWWSNRIKASANLFDIVRIDHFRGFESFYAIPSADLTAEKGSWKRGPGYDLFKKVMQAIGNVEIIAEDLGFITDEVKEMLKKTGFPGMKVLEFAFDSSGGSDYLPHNYTQNCVVYTGTHDNDTLKGWLDTTSKADIKFLMKYLNIKDKNDICWGIIRSAWSSTADTAIAQMQDFLNLGSKARMNIPSTIGGNWCWRMKESELSNGLSKKLKKITRLYNR